MVLPGMYERECLNQFHDRCLNLSDEEKKSKSMAIDKLVRHIHQQDFLDCYSVSEVVKGGSLGKGTAVRGQSDVDLVVFLNDLDGIEDFKSKRSQILSDMKKKLSGYQGLTIKGSTPYSLQCTFGGENLDVLPAIKINEKSAYQAIKMYNGDPVAEAQNYSASLTKLQVDFVSPQKETVKRVIRLIKYWRTALEVDVPSYTLELIVIYAYKTQSKDCSTRTLFLAVVALLVDAGHFNVDFQVHYQPQEYKSIAGIKAPYVLDPANPFKDTLAGKDVYEITKAARVTMSKCQGNPYL